MMVFHFDRAENTVGKGENADYQHFLLCPQCFPKPTFLGSLKLELCGKVLSKLKENKFFVHSKVLFQWVGIKIWRTRLRTF